MLKHFPEASRLNTLTAGQQVQDSLSYNRQSRVSQFLKYPFSAVQFALKLSGELSRGTPFPQKDFVFPGRNCGGALYRTKDNVK